MKHTPLLALVLLVFTASAHALLITPTTHDGILWTSGNSVTGTSTSQNDIDAELNALAASVGAVLTEAYKQNVGGGESGGFASSYTTTFFNQPNDPQEALIDYISGPAITGSAFLLVKDGNQVPSYYLFSLVGLWNGTDDIRLEGFWPQQGAISHVTLYTTPGVPTPFDVVSVPDGGTTVAMLGMALSGLAGARRFFA